MKKTWKIGVVKDTSKPMLGLHGHHVAFRGLPNVEVVGLVDANPDDLEGKMSVTRAKRHYPTLDAMLEKESLDIIVLCSRHPADHLPQIKAAAEKGCHVYCEKPVSAVLTDIDTIVALSEKHRIKICAAHPARYGTPFRTMKKMVESGEIGPPISVHGRGKNDHRGGGEDLIVLGTHILDFQTFLFDAPEWVFADVTANGRPITKADRTDTVEPIGPVAGDKVFAYFHFSGGVNGTFASERGLFDRKDGVIHMGVTVIGTKGSLSLRFQDGRTPDAKLRINRRPGPVEDGSDYEEVPLTEKRSIPGAEPLDYSLIGQPDIPGAEWFLEANRFTAWDLIQSIQEDRQPISNIHNARLALEMIHGVYASSLSERAVHLPLTNRRHPLIGQPPDLQKTRPSLPSERS